MLKARFMAIAQPQMYYNAVIFKSELNHIIIGDVMEKAFVCVSTDPMSVPDVFQKIKEVEGTEEVEMVYGVYDVCFTVKAETIDGLERTINDRIRRMENVHDTLATMLVNSQ